MLQDAGARYLYVTDSTYNGSYAHSLKVAAAFKKAVFRFPGAAFCTNGRPA